MVEISFDPFFEKKIKKIKNQADKIKLKKQIRKIIEIPEIGKPMRYTRKGTREVYIPPFRSSYMFLKEENKILFLDIYHKDE